MELNFIISLLGIIAIDILLAGDNAIVIALAVRGLPEHQRKIGVILGTAVAIILRIIFAFAVLWLLKIPFLKMIGGLLLFWIAVKLITDEEDHGNVNASDKLWKAVYTIAIADAVMSLDNVIAITAMARGDMNLIILGILISIPLVIFGATLILKLIDRYPAIIWLGAGLLGFLAGEMLLTDIKSLDWISAFKPSLVILDDNPMIGRKTVAWLTYSAGAIGALLVLGIAWFLKKKHKTA
jgi:YjbE family integral membrane protein